MTNIANILTLSRIAAIPLIAALLFFNEPALRWIAFILFAVACITDFFDGYIARRMDQVSALGRFLDPIADKLVVAAILMVMTAHGQIRGWVVLPALIILCREILVSGLREYLAELKVRLPVSMLAKWKTTMQMIAMGFLIVGDVMPGWPIQLVGEGLMWLAAALTLLTGYDYFRVGLKHMTEDDRADAKK